MALSPALFLSAVYALAGDAFTGGARGASLGVGMAPGTAACDLIHRAGWSAHYSPRFGVSEWPVPPVQSAAELRAFGESAGIMMSAPMPGDLYGCARDTAGFGQVGVVVQVVERSPLPRVFVYRCDVAFALDDGAIRRGLRWFAADLGDGFVRWVDLDPVRTVIEPEWYLGQRRR
jgi:hypothetical protein